MLDVITLGETMIRLSPPNHERLEVSNSLNFRIGGSESNVAVALARLGLKTGWISKLTNNLLGRRIENELKRWNVDVNGVVWTSDHRIGTYYAEIGSDPRPTNVIYDRTGSAFSQMTIDDIDWNYLSSCKVFHTTGITVALSPNCESVVKECLKFMNEDQKLTSFDINHRTKLWTDENARKRLEKILPKVDILFSSEGDLDLIFKPKGELEEKAAEILEKFKLKLLALTRGPNPPYVLEDNGNAHFGKGYRPKVVDRIGAGDAFDAGFLFGYLSGDIEMAIKYGEAMSALKFSIPGDMAIVTKTEVEDFILREKKWVNR